MKQTLLVVIGCVLLCLLAGCTTPYQSNGFSGGISDTQYAPPVHRPPIIHNSYGGGHWIERVMDGGKIIKLEDGSLWSVEPLDRIDSALWLSLDNITVIEGDDLKYPYKLVNTDENEVVNARKLQ